MKYLIKTILLALALSLGLVSVSAQEIIEEQLATKQNDSIKSDSAIKIDAVSAVVGDYIVLESDIDKTILQLKSQGASIEGVSRCQLFGKLLEDKLYAHHAIQDSIEISDLEIRSYVDQQVERFLQSTKGSMEELLKIYKKNTEKEFRDEMFEINKSNRLASEMQKKIVDEVEVTPEEVRAFFNKIPKNERPEFGTELKVAQIVIEPKTSSEEEQRVINRLKEFKNDVLNNGASFRSKVVLYTDDKASIPSGGKYTLNRKRPQMVKEFRETTFSMEEGQISEPFKTAFGYHIIYLEKIRGQEYDVRHILLTPKVSNAALAEAKKRLQEVRTKIISGKISFSEAAKEVSDEKETKFNGGKLINPTTEDYNFELTKMNTELYTQIQGLKSNTISEVISEQDRKGAVKFKIMTVTDRIDAHEADYSRDYLKIKELALNEKRFKTIDKWQDDKIKETYIKIGGTYRDCDFNSNWLKK